MIPTPSASADPLRVDVNAMPKAVFTGDSQTCGRVGALDYPQMLSWNLPIRAINTSVGGTNTHHLLSETRGGAAEIAKGEKVIAGTEVNWGSGPYPGQTIRLGRHHYLIDRIEVVSHQERRVNLWIAEPAREDFSGLDHAIEAGWRVRVAAHRPDYVCFMYSVNDTGWSSGQFRAHLEDLVARTKALGAQPILLSGFPLMEASRGGSHPGDNQRVREREQDLIAFSEERNIPFGKVFGTLMLMDGPGTAVWADTVHPTTDGSTAALKALRSIFRALGLTENPYYLRGYRATDKPTTHRDGLTPFTTSQPDYDVNNQLNDNHFDREAIRVRDECGLMAAADGQVVESERPVVLEFGVGDPEALESIQVEIVTPSRVSLAFFDGQKNTFQDLARGQGKISAALPRDLVSRATRDRALWLALHGDGRIALDYAAVILKGHASPFAPPQVRDSIIWPPADELKWLPEGNLIPNGDLTRADGDAPEHWHPQGDQALYLRSGVVSRGRGGFVRNQRIDRFKSAGQHFTWSLRPLDMLNIAPGPAGARGDFLIARILDDETLLVRRFPDAEEDGLAFEIERTSGCLAVPGGCMIECRAKSGWRIVRRNVEPGRYRLGFFYRAYDPARMNASDRPGPVARVTVCRGKCTLAAAHPVEASYQWQREWLEFEVREAGEIAICAAAETEVAVNYTGFTLHRL